MSRISVTLNAKEARFLLVEMRSLADSSEDPGVVQVATRVAKRIERETLAASQKEGKA